MIGIPYQCVYRTFFFCYYESRHFTTRLTAPPLTALRCAVIILRASSQHNVYHDTILVAHLVLLSFCPTKAIVLSLFTRDYSFVISGKHSAREGWVELRNDKPLGLNNHDCQKPILMTGARVHKDDFNERQNDWSNFACGKEHGSKSLNGELSIHEID